MLYWQMVGSCQQHSESHCWLVSKKEGFLYDLWKKLAEDQWKAYSSLNITLWFMNIHDVWTGSFLVLEDSCLVWLVVAVIHSDDRHDPGENRFPKALGLHQAPPSAPSRHRYPSVWSLWTYCVTKGGSNPAVRLLTSILMVMHGVYDVYAINTRFSNGTCA